MQSIGLSYLEHQIAPRLERDINELYLNIRFKGDREYNTQFWEERLLEYIHDWHLLFVTNDFYYRIWLDKLMACYRASQIELNIRCIRDLEQVKKLITATVKKLELIFLSVDILEELKEKNTKYSKQIERYQEEYNQATKYCYDLNKINVVCAYQPSVASTMSIQKVTEHIRIFNKFLKQESHFPVKYLYWYRRVVRLPDTNEYVMLLSLTLNGKIYSNTLFYIERLKELWSFATAYTGIVIDLQDESQFGNHIICSMFCEFDDQDDLDSLLKRDITNTDKDSMSIRVWPAGFKHFIGSSPSKDY
ncbi:hypothetical protein BRY75_13805 [Acinetobacter baumannii]|uniref:hypothetical protein n=1 Tax=Acinetobacter baumannii TaxID=470 RepID=UPI0009273F94|nr:hypothetical protein [Acinetobacter baumannii]OJK06374.1 hypothetical protein BRY75_13805 [Acinetobacter baumannii]